MSVPVSHLSDALTATFEEAPALSVADATVEEGPNAKLRFVITLDRAATETVTVEASTSDGTATAGADYRAKTLTKTFAPGETSKIEVERYLKVVKRYRDLGVPAQLTNGTKRHLGIK